MSQEELEAWRVAARERGVSVAELVLAGVRSYLGAPARTPLPRAETPVGRSVDVIPPVQREAVREELEPVVPPARPRAEDVARAVPGVRLGSDGGFASRREVRPVPPKQGKGRK